MAQVRPACMTGAPCLDFQTWDTTDLDDSRVKKTRKVSGNAAGSRIGRSPVVRLSRHYRRMPILPSITALPSPSQAAWRQTHRRPRLRKLTAKISPALLQIIKPHRRTMETCPGKRIRRTSVAHRMHSTRQSPCLAVTFALPGDNICADSPKMFHNCRTRNHSPSSCDARKSFPMKILRFKFNKIGHLEQNHPSI